MEAGRHEARIDIFLFCELDCARSEFRPPDLSGRRQSMRIRSKLWAKAVAVALVVSCGLVLPAGSKAQTQQVPRYKFDPDWPKLPLPNKWWMMGVTGMYVDKDDHIWVLTRPRDINNTQNYAQLNPPTAECCIAPPTVIEFDTQGNVINSWDAPQGHGMMVDKAGFVWIGSDTVRKYNGKDGKLIDRNSV